MIPQGATKKTTTTFFCLVEWLLLYKNLAKKNDARNRFDKMYLFPLFGLITCNENESPSIFVSLHVMRMRVP